MGLSSDSSFVEKVLKAINPHKFGEKSGLAAPFEVNQMTLKDFIKIFKKDQISEKLTESLRKIVVKEKEAQRIKAERMYEEKRDQLQIVKGPDRNVAAPTEPNVLDEADIYGSEDPQTNLQG